MSNIFFYYRILIPPVSQGLLFPEKEQTNEDVITNIFTKKNFSFAEGKYHYVFKNKFGNIIWGKVAKRNDITRVSPPEQGLEEKIEDTYPNVDIFINTSDEKETGLSKELGQVIAIRQDSAVFPVKNYNGILPRMSKHINRSFLKDERSLFIVPIEKKHSGFWEYINEPDIELKKLEFEYIAPNLFGADDDLSEDLKKLNEKTNINKVKLELQSQDRTIDKEGLKNIETITQGVDYITAGQGKYKITYKRKNKEKTDTFSSTTNIKSKRFEGIDLDIKNLDKDQAIEIIKKILEG